MVQQVAIRLGTTGKGEVKSDFAEVGRAGTAAMKGIGDGARAAGDVSEQQARRMVAAHNRAVDDIEAAERRRAATAAKLAAIQPQTAVQMRINDAVGTGYSQPEGSAKRSALAFRELIAEQERMEQRTRALMAAIDPAWAAQERFNSEIREAKTLLDAGRISVDQFALAENKAKTALDQATQSAVRHNTANGAARAGMQQLSFQINDVATMYALGAKPMQIFASQAGQVTQAVGLMTQGGKGLIGFLGGPWGMAITTATIVLVPLVSKLLEGEQAMKAVELASDGLGEAQSVLGQMFDLTTGKIKSQTDMLMANAQAMAINLRAKAAEKEASVREVMSDAASGRRAMFDFSRGLLVSGRQQIDNEQRARTVQSWQQQYAEGTLSPRNYQKLVETFDFRGLRVDKQELLQAIADDATARASRETAEGIDRTLDTGKLDRMFIRDKPDKKPPKPKVDRHAETLARESEATESLIANLGKLADAYAISDDAAIKAQIVAEATEKGIKKQADVTAYVAQQTRLSVAKETAATAEKAANLRVENDLRDKANEKVRQGLMTAAQAEQWLRDEAQLRRTVAMEALAEGDAKTKLIEANARLRDEQQRAKNGERDRLVQRYDDQFRDAMELADEEGRLIGKSNAERERTLSMLRLKQELDANGIGAESQQGRLILANNEALARKVEYVRRQADAWQEVTRIGENFIDTVLNLSNWNDWGSLGKKVLRDLINDMWTLAAINPLKNMMFGSDLPVAGGVLGQLGKIGGGGKGNNILPGETAGTPDSLWKIFNGIGSIGSIFGFAAGTEYFAGGAARVGEHGEETVFLPRGSKIMTAAETRRMRGGDRPVIHQSFDLRGSVVLEDLYRQMQEISRSEVQAAAPGIADMGMRRTVDASRRSHGRLFA